MPVFAAQLTVALAGHGDARAQPGQEGRSAMSLTSQLAGRELAAWCAEHFVSSTSVAEQVAAATQGHRPVRPAGAVDGRHWAEIGGSFGLRLAALVEPAPPYYALYGLVRAELVSRTWADVQAGEYPSHAGLPDTLRRRSLELRPTPAGWWDLGLPHDPRRPGTPAAPVLADFLDRARHYFAEHAPPGQLGTPAVEGVLARVCWLLSAAEDVYRSAQITTEVPAALDALFGAGVPTVEQMLQAAPGPVVTELVELTRRLHTSGSLAALRTLAGDPPAGQALGVAGPVLVHHWADGDLLIGTGQETTLLDVKTIIRTDRADRTVRWLHQLVGYAWLDIRDRYRIRQVGLYLARHGVLLTWPLEELADRLLGGRTPIVAARSQFLRVATGALTAEGAHLPT
jgi:hypothetical protein